MSQAGYYKILIEIETFVLAANQEQAAKKAREMNVLNAMDDGYGYTSWEATPADPEYLAEEDRHLAPTVPPNA